MLLWTRRTLLFAAAIASGALALVLGGCSSDYTNQPFVPGAHAALPQVAQYSGPIVESPSIVPITFAGDARAAALHAFTAQIGQTAYWSAIASEYGVGPATQPYVVDGAKQGATVDDRDIQKTVTYDLDDGFRAITVSTIFVFFYPPGTTITFTDPKSGKVIARSCSEFKSYHKSVATPGVGHVQYAVIASCPDDDDPLAAATVAASQELIGAATDPRGKDDAPDPAFLGTDDDSNGFAMATDLIGEIGDMCAASPDATFKPDDFPFMVQRAWSNAAAAAGKNPCVPAPTTPYFNTMPAANDTIFVDSPVYGGVTTRGVALANGDTTTIAVRLWSSVPTGEWTVAVHEKDPSDTPALALSLDRTKGQNGDVLHLKIGALNVDKQGAAFVIESTLGGVTYTSGGVVAAP
jgi:hypothetical protein